MKRPTIINPCHASSGSGSGETVFEVRFTDGSTCLISARAFSGVNSVEILETSAMITVRVDGEEIEMEPEA